jgi:hypothetical protein
MPPPSAVPSSLLRITSEQILAARPAKNRLDPWRPYQFLVEPERGPAGAIEPTATIFLTNRECPYRCLMCDLWKNTTDFRVPSGAIAAQIDYALSRLEPATQVKLYNSGNFFDAQAIPPADLPAVAVRVAPFRTVVVENHPRLCGIRCVDFARRLAGELEIALGLETVHPQILERLNKGMRLADFDRAVDFLLRHKIAVRAFVLLRAPYQSEAEGIEWAIRSVEYAFSRGVRCVSVIPTRGGNGILEILAAQGEFAPPSLAALEQVLAAGLALGGGRVFVELWDVERLSSCPRCGPARARRLAEMNLSQQTSPPIVCDCVR